MSKGVYKSVYNFEERKDKTMNNLLKINNTEVNLENTTETIKYIKTYIRIRIALLILKNIVLIITAIILFNISKELAHFCYHAFDCCHYLF